MREILLNISLVAIALCLFKMLVPENSMKKQADFLIACFFLVSLAFFFTVGRVDFAAELEAAGYSASGAGEAGGAGGEAQYADFEAQYADAQKRAAEREIRSIVANALKPHGFTCQEIYVNINISDKYSISINEIRLVFEGDEQDEAQLDILKQAIHIVQKEVGDDIVITGKLKMAGNDNE